MELLACLAPLLVIVLTAFVLTCLGWRSRRRFNEKWPPISDDEFVRRCAPGVRPQTALKVRRIVADQLGVPYEQVYPEQSFVNDLGID